MDWYGIPRARVHIKNFAQVHIGDALTPEIKYWRPEQAVFISAQTGAGKSHFIMHTLLPHILQPAHHFSTSDPEMILVLSNRLANNKQFKLDLNKCVKEYPSDANESEIQRIGNVYIYTYQNILSKIGSIPPWGVRYIVLDEAHFFIQDASFNSDTHAILQAILFHFPFAVRIYMSATFQDCALPIYEMECRYIQRLRTSPPESYPYFPKTATSFIRQTFQVQQQNFYPLPCIDNLIKYTAKCGYVWRTFKNDQKFRSFILGSYNLTDLSVDYYKKFQLYKLLKDYSEYFENDPPMQNIKYLSKSIINFCCAAYQHTVTHGYEPVCEKPFTELKKYLILARQYAFHILLTGFNSYITHPSNTNLYAQAQNRIYNFLYKEVSYARKWFYAPNDPIQFHSEDKSVHWLYPVKIYEFQRDYSPYQIYKYKNLTGDLAERIVSQYAVGLTEKWLIFVNSKKSGRKLCTWLQSKHQISAICIDADSANTQNTSGKPSIEKRYCDNMIEQQHFPKYVDVVISTSMLDSGISLWDPNLKHIVLSVFDEVMMLQMIGRKRFDLQNQDGIINLYFPIQSALPLSTLIQQQHRELEFLNRFKYSIKDAWRYNSYQYTQLPKYFRFMPQTAKQSSQFSLNVRLELNQFAPLRLRNSIEFYEQIQTYIKENPTDGYAAWAANKLGISEIHDIPQSCHNAVLNLIHEWHLLDNDISLSKEELETFYNEFLTVYNEQAYGYTQKDKQNNRTKSQINNAFKNLKIPYSFIKRNNRFYLQSVSNKDD